MQHSMQESSTNCVITAKLFCDPPFSLPHRSVVVPRPGPGAAPEPRQITFGAWEAGWVHGMAEFIAQEEMDRGQALAVPDRVVENGELIDSINL